METERKDQNDQTEKKRTHETARVVERRRLYRFAYARVTVTVLLALLCAGILISIVNDVYAFVKPNVQATLVVDAPQSLADTAADLRRLGLIQNPTVFQWYVNAKNKRSQIEAFSGSLPLNASMSYREILLAFGN